MEITKRDIDLMAAIADRGLKLSFNNGLNRVKKLDLMMDLEYAHGESPLDFEKLLAFDDGNFAHDIIGIYENFNRETLKMDNCFSPRCTLREGISLAVANEATLLDTYHDDAIAKRLEKIDESGLGRDSS